MVFCDSYNKSSLCSDCIWIFDGFTNSFIIISSLLLIVGSWIGGVGGYGEEDDEDDWLTSSLIVDEFDANESIINQNIHDLINELTNSNKNSNLILSKIDNSMVWMGAEH